MAHVCPSWLSFILDNPVRKVFTDRQKILDESCMTKESTVLEIGAGTGFMTETIAERVKKVYCVELQIGMVKKLKLRVKRFDTAVEVVQADIATSDLRPAAVDVCLLYYCFHEIADKTRAVEVIGRTVKNNGVLSIYEPTIEVGRSDMQKFVGMFESAGFERDLEQSTLFTRFARLRKKQDIREGGPAKASERDMR